MQLYTASTAEAHHQKVASSVLLNAFVHGVLPGGVAMWTSNVLHLYSAITSASLNSLRSNVVRTVLGSRGMLNGRRERMFTRTYPTASKVVLFYTTYLMY